MQDSYLYRLAREYGQERMQEAANERLVRQACRGAAVAADLTGWSRLNGARRLRRRLEGIAGRLAAGRRGSGGQRHVAQEA